MPPQPKLSDHLPRTTPAEIYPPQKSGRSRLSQPDREAERSSAVTQASVGGDVDAVDQVHRWRVTQRDGRGGSGSRGVLPPGTGGISQAVVTPAAGSVSGLASIVLRPGLNLLAVEFGSESGSKPHGGVDLDLANGDALDVQSEGNANAPAEGDQLNRCRDRLIVGRVKGVVSMA